MIYFYNTAYFKYCKMRVDYCKRFIIWGLIIRGFITTLCLYVREVSNIKIKCMRVDAGKQTHKDIFLSGHSHMVAESQLGHLQSALRKQTHRSEQDLKVYIFLPLSCRWETWYHKSEWVIQDRVRLWITRIKYQILTLPHDGPII